MNLAFGLKTQKRVKPSNIEAFIVNTKGLEKGFFCGGGMEQRSHSSAYDLLMLNVLFVACIAH